MKKKLVTILATAMTMSLLSGTLVCHAEEETELNIAVFEGGYGRDYWDAVVAAFEEENPGVKVNVEANPKIGDIIRPNILSGNVPDFVYLPSYENSGVTKALIKDNALADISDVMEPLKEQILPGFLENDFCQPYGDGKTYLAPIYYSTCGLWYNKNFFETNGLEVPTTWDEFFALGDKEEELGRDLFTYQGIYPSYLESLIFPAIASAAGVDVASACLKYDTEAWQNENVKIVLENIAKIGTDGYMLDGTVAMDHTQAQSQWLLGKAMFHPNGSWVEGEMKDAPKEDGFEYGFAAAPTLNVDGDKYVYTQIEEMFIPAAAKNIDLAKKFLAFQYSDKAIQLNAEKAKGVPPVVGAAKYLEDQISPATYESITIFDQGYLPFPDKFANVEDTEILPADEFWSKVTDVMSGTLSVDDWIAQTIEMCNQVKDKMVK